MAKRGQKTKLTKEAVTRAVQLKKGGANNKDIAAALGVCEQTFYRWTGDPKTALQRELCEELKKAEADYKNALLAVIAKASRERDWKAAAWLLERKYPGEYARTDRVQATVQQETSATVEVVHYFDYGDGEDE